ncbi:MAG: tRNA (adenosine(37)-N6)-threonylcarbamoyltransferase complex ATPase subunit type 1 TsaE [Ostreibacterium sp.]
MKQIISIDTLGQLTAFTIQFASTINSPAWIYLIGDLGTGKTTFAQQFIAAKGYTGRVASPTYAIMQNYPTPNGMVIHCDLYRLSEPEELDDIGVIEQAENDSAITLVEWPEKGKGVLPAPDITLTFIFQGESRHIIIDTAD